MRIATNDVCKIIKDVQPKRIPNSVFEKVAKSIAQLDLEEVPSSKEIYKILESSLENDDRYPWRLGHSDKAAVTICHKILETSLGEVYCSADLARINKPYMRLWGLVDSFELEDLFQDISRSLEGLLMSAPSDGYLDLVLFKDGSILHLGEEGAVAIEAGGYQKVLEILQDSEYWTRKL